MSELAIIIPAYKDKFLSKVLNSLEHQTCQDFTIYVGDDASPYDINGIVARYSNRLHISYYRFETNLGGRDLVGQWERCIALSKNEPWIWLFSDDDEMDPECVADFYKEIAKIPKYDLYHFDVETIDEQSYILTESEFPDWMTSNEFAIKKLKGEISSYVVEYVFSRTHYEQCGKFQKFDLAWGSDDATWIKLGKDKGIKTIKGAKVKWRKSSLNISPNNTDIIIINRKIEANLDFLKWQNSFMQLRRLEQIKMRLAEMTWFCTNLSKYKIGTRITYHYLKKACDSISCPMWYIATIVYYEIKKRIL